MGLHQDQAVALGGQVPHLAVSGPVMKSYRGEIIESLVQIVSDVSYKSKTESKVWDSK